MRLVTTLALSVALGSLACQADKPAASAPAAQAAPAVAASPGPSSAGLSAAAQAGHQLYAVCDSCHNQELWPAKAPPMFGVQRRYLRATKDEAEFIERMVTFINTPTAETAVMTPAVEKLGLMPALPLGDEPLRALAAYIREAEFPPPCTHWKNVLAEAAAAPPGDGHVGQDRKMYDKLCK